MGSFPNPLWLYIGFDPFATLLSSGLWTHNTIWSAWLLLVEEVIIQTRVIIIIIQTEWWPAGLPFTTCLFTWVPRKNEKSGILWWRRGVLHYTSIWWLQLYEFIAHMHLYLPAFDWTMEHPLMVIDNSVMSVTHHTWQR